MTVNGGQRHSNRLSTLAARQPAKPVKIQIPRLSGHGDRNGRAAVANLVQLSAIRPAAIGLPKCLAPDVVVNPAAEIHLGSQFDDGFQHPPTWMSRSAWMDLTAAMADPAPSWLFRRSGGRSHPTGFGLHCVSHLPGARQAQLTIPLLSCAIVYNQSPGHVLAID